MILVSIIGTIITSNSNIAIAYTPQKLVQVGPCTTPALCESIVESAPNTQQQQQQIASSHAFPNSLTATTVYHSREGLESSPVALSSSITSTVKHPGKGMESNIDLTQLGDYSRSASQSILNNPNPNANTYTAKVNTRMETGTAQLSIMTNKRSLVQQNPTGPTVASPATVGSLSLVHQIACRHHTVWENRKPIDCILELQICTPLSQYDKCGERRTD